MNRQATAECKRELKVVWEMFKNDPLSPFTAYCRRYVVTGMGMFTEGYTICKYPTCHHARSCAPFLFQLCAIVQPATFRHVPRSPQW